MLLVALLALSAFVWSKVFKTNSDPNAAVRCNPPGTPSVTPATPAPPPPKPGQGLPRDALDRTDPVPASDLRVTVLNANGQRGQAGLVAEELLTYGVNKAHEPTNDATYPNSDMTCIGQIRFGANGASAARTLSLLVPCAELVRDERQDATVDLALGKEFDGLTPTADGRRVLDQLKEWAETQPEQRGGQQNAATPPPLDRDALAAARDVHC